MKTIAAGKTEIVTLPDPKGPEDKLLYRMDWTGFLTPLADTVVTSDWDADGLTATDPQVETGNLSATVWLAGGTAGVTYTVRNKITSVSGRTVERSFRLQVAER